MLVDSHCHLDFPNFDEDRDAVLDRARASGVETIVSINTRVRRFPELRALVDRYPRVYCSVGTHPHNAAEEPDVTTDELVRLAADPKVVAIGEAGLDYHYDNSPRDAQRASFLKHIVGDILEAETGQGAFPAILHCFSSGRDLARRGVALGLAVSFSGMLTFKRSDELRDIAREIPLDRLLVETDAPYLAPVPHRGRRNEPAYVVETAKVLAEVRGMTPEALARATTDNFYRIFSKIERPA